jgi:hypothetical protein
LAVPTPDSNLGTNGVTGAISRPAPKPKPKPKVRTPKSRTVPTVKWTRLHPGLSLEDAEARLHIREFMLRFEPVMKPTIAKTHLEELAYITAGTVHDYDDDDDDDDSGELTPWVSEPCCKSIILGLLGILAEEAVADAGTVSLTTCRFISELKFAPGYQNCNSRNSVVRVEYFQNLVHLGFIARRIRRH